MNIIRMQWDGVMFEAGKRARDEGYAMTTAPKVDSVGLLRHRSWCAGWADVDTKLKSETYEAFSFVVEMSQLEADAIKRWGDAEQLGGVPFEAILQCLFYDRLHRLMLRQVEPTAGY